jgi:hypothetical protein
MFSRKNKKYIGKEDFGTWKDGSSVFKDKKGFYVVQWDPKKNIEYKKYLNNWKPKPQEDRLVLIKNKWKIKKSKKNKYTKEKKGGNPKTKKRSNSETSETSDTSNPCSICLESLNNGDVSNLRCNHSFHRDCINRSITQQNNNSIVPTCPLCRTNIHGENRNTSLPEHLLPYSHGITESEITRAIVSPSPFTEEEFINMSLEQRREAHQDYSRMRRNFLASRRRRMGRETLQQRIEREQREFMDAVRSRYERSVYYGNQNPVTRPSSPVPVTPPGTPPSNIDSNQNPVTRPSSPNN